MIPRSPAIRHGMKKSQDAKNIPPIGPNITLVAACTFSCLP